MIPKFRIFDKDTKEWQSIRSIGLEEDGSILYIQCWDKYEVDIDPPYFMDNLGIDFELMQSTGLRDKNGIEIYEGDILNHPLQGMRKVYYPFNDRVASYGLENIENGMRSTLQDAHRLYEVIGNIHEHSHLLDNEGE